MTKGELFFCGSRLTGAYTEQSDLDCVFVLDEKYRKCFNRKCFFVGEKMVELTIMSIDSKNISDGKILYSKKGIELPKFSCCKEKIIQINPNDIEKFISEKNRKGYKDSVLNFIDNPVLNFWFDNNWKDFELRIMDQIDYIMNGNKNNRQILTRLSGEEFGDTRRHERSSDWLGRIEY